MLLSLNVFVIKEGRSQHGLELDVTEEAPEGEQLLCRIQQHPVQQHLRGQEGIHSDDHALRQPGMIPFRALLL